MKSIPTNKEGIENESYSYLDCAEKVLDTCAQRIPVPMPMHYREIMGIALEKGWIVSTAKDPARSLHGCIWQDVKKEAPSRFILDKRTGMVSLVKWGNTSLIKNLEDHNRDQKEKLLNLLRSMHHAKFEAFVAEIILPAMGFEECEATQPTRDKGIDAVGQLVIHDSVRVDVAVQVKRYKKTRVGIDTVLKLRGALNSGQQGIVITTSDYTRDAENAAKDASGKQARISLINGEKIVELLMEMDWENWAGDEKGIEIKHLKMIQVNKNFFAEFGNTPNAESILPS